MSLFKPRHPVTDTAGMEELHEIQLIKAITSSHIFIRISTYNKNMTERILGKLVTKRSKLYKTILFYNI